MPVLVLRRLRQRYDAVAREVAKFGAVGAVNTVLDFAILNALVFGLGVSPLRAKVVSTVIAATSSYVMNRHWTFRHRGRQGVRREYTLFFGLNAVGLAISLLILWVVRYGFGLQGALALNAANVLAMVFATLFRFWSYRRFVWLSPAQVQEAADDGDVAAGVVLDLGATAHDSDKPVHHATG